jgi:hypothetical protein
MRGHRERLAIDRAKQLFGAEHANVQPHCGSANMAVYFAMLQPGDTILGMNLAHGGHLTHGHKMNFSGRYYNVVPYGVDPKDRAHQLRRAGRAGPAPAQAEADLRRRQRLLPHHRLPRLRQIADSVGALLMVDMAHIAGLVAAGLHPNPVPYADVRHHHHPQDPARPARRPDPVPPAVRAGDRQAGVPRHPGRPAHAHHRRQGGVLPGGPAAGLQGLRSSRWWPMPR